MTGAAVERVEAVVGAESGPAVGLDPGAAEQHPGHGGLEIVVADLIGRDAAEPFEGVDVAFQKRLLSLGQRRAVRGPAREREPHREQRGLGLDATQDHPQVVEVHLGLGRRQMRLRHAALLQRPARLGGNLRAALGDVVPHPRVRQILRAVLVHQPGQNPPSRMTLLLRRVQITAQHLVDRRLERLQPRRGPHRYLAWQRDRTRQRLPHRAPVHPVLGRKLPNRQPVDPRIASDRGEQLHPRSHPSTPSVITNRLVITVKGATSSRHNRPGVSASGPTQAVTTTSTRPARWATSNRHGGANSGCHGQWSENASLHRSMGRIAFPARSPPGFEHGYLGASPASLACGRLEAEVGGCRRGAERELPALVDRLLDKPVWGRKPFTSGRRHQPAGTDDRVILTAPSPS
jgi:hypothetical protein